MLSKAPLAVGHNRHVNTLPNSVKCLSIFVGLIGTAFNRQKEDLAASNTHDSSQSKPNFTNHDRRKTKPLHSRKNKAALTGTSHDYPHAFSSNFNTQHKYPHSVHSLSDARVQWVGRDGVPISKVIAAFKWRNRFKHITRGKERGVGINVRRALVKTHIFWINLFNTPRLRKPC